MLCVVWCGLLQRLTPQSPARSGPLSPQSKGASRTSTGADADGFRTQTRRRGGGAERTNQSAASSAGAGGGGSGSGSATGSGSGSGGGYQSGVGPSRQWDKYRDRSERERTASGAASGSVGFNVPSRRGGRGGGAAGAAGAGGAGGIGRAKFAAGPNDKPAQNSPPLNAQTADEDEAIDTTPVVESDGVGSYTKEELLALAAGAPKDPPADVIAAAEQNGLSLAVSSKILPPVNTLPLTDAEQVSLCTQRRMRTV